MPVILPVLWQACYVTPAAISEPRQWPDKLHADKAYDHRRCRRECRARSITPRIARHGIESRERPGRYRWIVEPTLAWLARFRRIAIRYERRADLHPAFTTLAAPSSATLRPNGFVPDSYAADIRAMGATALFLFGSTAQDRAGPDSDLDPSVAYDPEGRFNGFDLVGIKLFLEDRPGIEVDLATRDGLHPMLRARIERTAIRIF